MKQTSPNREITITIDHVSVHGVLHIPSNPQGLVLFSHGSGSSRLSPRNNFIAGVLQHEHIGTFLFDLLTPEEDQTYENRFNINLLTERLIKITKHIRRYDKIKQLPLGYFGASTGAASAIRAAVQLKPLIKAIVSRGGRPDLVPIEDIVHTQTPTLLIVGAIDEEVIKYNQNVYAELGGIKDLEIIPGATHLFEEPGTLEKVAHLAVQWFKEYLK